jgi:hypothetical protein
LKNLIKSGIEDEKHNTQFHMPGFNYMGPGTNIITNILKDVRPINETDHVALHHDLDFLRANGDYMALMQSDWKAIKNSGFSLDSMLMKTGLTLRSILSTLTFNQINFGESKLTKEESALLANYLEDIHNTKYHQ